MKRQRTFKDFGIQALNHRKDYPADAKYGLVLWIETLEQLANICGFYDLLDTPYTIFTPRRIGFPTPAAIKRPWLHDRPELAHAVTFAPAACELGIALWFPSEAALEEARKLEAPEMDSHVILEVPANAPA